MDGEWLDPTEWQHHAQRLAVGGRIRVPHPCGQGTPLLITRESDRSTAYCFRCGGRGFLQEHESLQDRLDRVRKEESADASARAALLLPEPRLRDTKDWPLADKVWFFKMGLSPSHIERLGLYYCPAIGRVVLPLVNDDGEVIFWQARSVKRQPKWLAPDAPKDGLVVVFGRGKGDTIVLCEDALSAYKVGLVCEAWTLLGTKMHDKVLLALQQTGKRVATWLDDDVGRRRGENPGQDAARRIGGRLRAFGVDYRNITSERDPKYYPPDILLEKLNG